MPAGAAYQWKKCQEQMQTDTPLCCTHYHSLAKDLTRQIDVQEELFEKLCTD
jgi:hypothetical protein